MKNHDIDLETHKDLDGLEIFGGICSKLDDFYQGNCNENDLKNELELMIIIAHRMLKIPDKLIHFSI